MISYRVLEYMEEKNKIFFGWWEGDIYMRNAFRRVSRKVFGKRGYFRRGSWFEFVCVVKYESVGVLYAFIYIV